MTRQTTAMGSVLTVRVCARDHATAIDATEAVFAEARRVDQLLSSWRDDSSVGRVNLARGPVTVGPEVAGLLREALSVCRATDHAFDPAIGALIDIWGFRQGPRLPATQEIRSALLKTGCDHIEVKDSTLQRGATWIDTGGFGKGAALRSMADTLIQRGIRDFTINFGGQIMIGENVEAVDVAHPLHRTMKAFRLQLRSVSVSTSSQSERFIKIRGEKYGHILDPRTGRPVRAWGSVTVVSRDALQADGLSTAFLVMGARKALEYAERHPDVAVLVLSLDKRGRTHARWSTSLQPYLQETH